MALYYCGLEISWRVKGQLFRLVTCDFRRAPRNNTRPSLIYYYINDISTNITSTVKIYADDTKIYRTINEPDKDIWRGLISDWANKWQLRFNTEKWEVMRATRIRDRSKTSYSLVVQLKSVESVKDLGVTINYDLSWGKHVSYVVNNRHAFSCLFKSLVRPILEYAPPVWSPLPNKGYWIVGKNPNKSITVGLKAKARRNELWRPLQITELANSGET